MVPRHIGNRQQWFRRCVLFLFLNVILWSIAASTQVSTQAMSTSVGPLTPGVDYTPGVLLVKLKPDIQLTVKNEPSAANAPVYTGNQELNQTLATLGINQIRRLFETNTSPTPYAAGSKMRHENIYRLQLAANIDLSAALELLQANDAVVYAEPDFLARAALVPNDPKWNEQWALQALHTADAWDITQGTKTTVIALIDSGIDLSHPEFAGRLWQNDEIANNGIDDDQNGKIDDVNGWNFVASSNIITDANGHGTQVAGIASATGDNGLGMAGLCWQCSLMPVVAMQPNGVANYSTIAEAVLYAAENGADVINLSLGGYADSQTLRDAIAEAAATAVIVAAAGNDDDTAPFYPAAYANVIAVAATDSDDQKTIFSNYGPWVDIAAPGDMILTTTPGGYATLSGTSVASPFVAGTASLLKSLHPTWSPAMITWQILNTTVPFTAPAPLHIGQLGYGRITIGPALTQSPEARVNVDGYVLNGESNGRPEPGQTFPLVLTIRNLWMPGENLVGTLTSTDAYATISTAQSTFGDIEPGATTQNSTAPFQVTLQPNTPYNHVVTFTLTLTGDNGYGTSIPVPLQVRTSVETLGNTQYVENTTWTSDKSYVLNGSVIVGQGITLTIQPGTIVMVNPDKFIRVDGTLIARGTAQHPITLRGATTNTETKWGGIRFTDTALSASFDISGTYRSGSVVEHVDMAHADQALAAGTITPYVANSHFHHNRMAIVTSRGVMQITNNLFTDNQTGIFLEGGYPIVTQNQFIGNGGSGWATAIEGNGVPQIINNTFAEEQGESVIRIAAGAFLSSTVQVRDNRIVNNTGRIVFIGAESLEFEHNLIANNRPHCVGLSCAPNEIGILSIENYANSDTVLRNNSLIHNQAPSLQLVKAGAGSWTIENNNLLGNSEYDLYLSGGTPGTQNFTLTAAENYWGVESGAIAGRIHDCTFDENGCASSSATLGKIMFTPPLTEPAQTAPAFVHQVNFEPEPVGLNQVGTVTIDFSREMVTSTVPHLSFHDARRGTVQTFGGNHHIDIAEDTLGRIWVGTGQDAGMFDGRQWYTYTKSNSGLGSIIVTAVYGAANGDVWFGGELLYPGEVPVSRLQGTTWITYADVPVLSQSLVTSIGQDPQGNMWFGTAEDGAFRFDGISWQQITAGNGLSSNYVRDIVRDTYGRMWFMTGAGRVDDDPGGLDLFDGTEWQTYNKASGMPTNAYTEIFADSQGQVWVSIGYNSTRVDYVAMFGNSQWHIFGATETNGLLNCPASGFAEAQNGDIWMNSCDRMLIYRYGTWQMVSGIPVGYGKLFFDSKDNLWYTNRQVRWGGSDYLYENGKWLSTTRYQATYDFTALISQGDYIIDIRGAQGMDGIEIVPSAETTFRVDFGLAANPTPPLPPVVTGENDGTLTTITASWQSDSANIDQYRYAIGTTPGARDVVGWTYLSTTSMARSDLALIAGQTYYVSVQAHNTFGLWSASGVSNLILGGVITVSPTPSPTSLESTATPSPGTPTPTGLPTSTPTSAPTDVSTGTPMSTPTSTPTATPSATQILNSVGETTGAPGSRFVFTGSGFPPNTELPVTLQRLPDALAAQTTTRIGTVLSDANGNVAITIATESNTQGGQFQLTIGSTQQATITFTVDPVAPLQLPSAIGTIFNVTNLIFLPFVQR